MLVFLHRFPGSTPEERRFCTQLLVIAERLETK
jgi:hypothetical protein